MGSAECGGQFWESEHISCDTSVRNEAPGELSALTPTEELASPAGFRGSRPGPTLFKVRQTIGRVHVVRRLHRSSVGNAKQRAGAVMHMRACKCAETQLFWAFLRDGAGRSSWRDRLGRRRGRLRGNFGDLQDDGQLVGRVAVFDPYRRRCILLGYAYQLVPA